MIKKRLFFTLIWIFFLFTAVAFSDQTLTNVSGESIAFTDEELGTIAISPEREFEGITINITVNEGGPKGGIAGPLDNVY